MATFNETLGGERVLTPVAAHWFSPSIITIRGTTSILAPVTATYGSPPYAVSLDESRIDASGNVLTSAVPLVSYETGYIFTYGESEVAPNVRLLSYTPAVGPYPASSANDIVTQRFDDAGNPLGSPTTAFADISGIHEVRIADSATYGSAYVITYGVHDTTTNLEQINYAFFRPDGTPISGESGTLESFAVANNGYDTYGFGTLVPNSKPNPSYILLKGYQENGDQGVLYSLVSTTGVVGTSSTFVDPHYAAGSTGKSLGTWSWTSLAAQSAAGNDLALVLPYSYTDAAGATHAAVDVRLMNAESGVVGSNDTIALAQSTNSAVEETTLPTGGLVVGYSDNGTQYLREYDASGAVVGGASFALPSGTPAISLASLGDGRILVESTAPAPGGNQIVYDIYDTRQGITVDTQGETSPSRTVGSPLNDVFYVNGAAGPDTFDGGDGVDFLVTTQAAGSGTVLVDLKDGTVQKGGQVDAAIANFEGVTLGADPSVVLGLTSGVDLVYDGSGADSVYGQGATDYIQGGSGTNDIVGGSGNEIFYGNGGTDAMRGGSAANFMSGGSTASSTDTFYGTGGSDYVYGHGGGLTLFGGDGTESLTGGAGFNELIGSTQGDAQGRTGLNILNGGTGTDLFYAGIGTNLLYEGSGTDVFAGNAGRDVVYGGSGRSFVYGGSGTDVVTTGAGNQYLKAGSGQTYFNDTAANLHAGRFDQIDNFSGGKGTDLYLPTAVRGATRFVGQNGGTAILTAVGEGPAEVFVSNTSVATVAAHTHFTL